MVSPVCVSDLECYEVLERERRRGRGEEVQSRAKGVLHQTLLRSVVPLSTELWLVAFAEPVLLGSLFLGDLWVASLPRCLRDVVSEYLRPHSRRPGA